MFKNVVIIGEFVTNISKAEARNKDKEEVVSIVESLPILLIPSRGRSKSIAISTRKRATTTIEERSKRRIGPSVGIKISILSIAEEF